MRKVEFVETRFRLWVCPECGHENTTPMDDAIGGFFDEASCENCGEWVEWDEPQRTLRDKNFFT